MTFNNSLIFSKSFLIPYLLPTHVYISLPHTPGCVVCPFLSAQQIALSYYLQHTVVTCLYVCLPIDHKHLKVKDQSLFMFEFLVSITMLRS